MSYATYSDIRAFSTLSTVQDAGDSTIDRWSAQAVQEIDQFCSRDFTFEAATEKTLYVTGPTLTLQKEVADITSASLTSPDGQQVKSLDVSIDLRVLPPNNRTLKIFPLNVNPLSTTRSTPLPWLLTMEADWGTDPVPTPVQVVFKRLVERIAVRESEDDVLQGHSFYMREDPGDGYSYDRSNKTLRNLLRPEDRAQLWPYVYHGRVIV